MNLPNSFSKYKIHLSFTMFNNIFYQIQRIMPPKLRLKTLTRRFGRLYSRNSCNSPNSLKNDKPTHQNKSEYPFVCGWWLIVSRLQIKHFPFPIWIPQSMTMHSNFQFRMHYSLSCLECNRNSGSQSRLHSNQDKMQNKFPFSLSSNWAGSLNLYAAVGENMKNKSAVERSSCSEALGYINPWISV